MTIRAVIWDIDGTLIDSEPAHLAALIDVSARHGVYLSAEPDDRFLGIDLAQVWDELRPLYPPRLSQATWTGQIVEAYRARTGAQAIFKPMTRTLRALAQLSVPQACVSNSERAIVDTNLAALRIENLIAFSVSRDDVTVGKPDPEGYETACRTLRISPREVLAVEDSDAGIRAATGAGLAVIRCTPKTTENVAAAILAMLVPSARSPVELE